MKSREYWEKRSNQNLLDALKASDKMLKTLKEDYDKAIFRINKDVESLYGRFAKDNRLEYSKAVEVIKGTEYKEWRYSMEKYMELIEDTKDEALLLELNTLAMRSRIHRLEAIEGEILANLAILAESQDKKATDVLSKALENTYYNTMYEHYKDSNPEALALMERHKVKLSKADIEKVLSLPWSGSNYSKRIWKREYNIAHKVKDLVTQNIIAGTSLERLSKVIEDELGRDYKNAAKTLIHTETAFVKGQGDLLVYEKLEVEEYEFSATLDTKTSQPCREQDGKHYKVSEAVPGLNYPPMHPRCRSATIVYRKDKEGIRAARDSDGKAYKVPAGMTYSEWYEKYVRDEEKSNIILDRLPQYSSTIEILGRVKNGEINLNLNHEHYEKHYKGTNQYNNYLESRKNRNWGPQNRLIISEIEAQELINKFHAKGIAKHGKNNLRKWYEEVNTNKIIGYYTLNGKEYPTTKIRIYYSKEDSHIIPIRGDDFD